MSKFPQRLKDRRDIGQVIFPIEQLMAVRELSSWNCWRLSGWAP